MRLTFYTDYSLRLLIYLGLHPDRLVTIGEVAESYGISRSHLMKVAHQLGREGFVVTIRGRNGGLRLARPPARIVVGDVVRAMEDDMRIVECFDVERNTCVIYGSCRLTGVLHEALTAWLAVLDNYTLAHLVAEPRRLVDTLKLPERTLKATTASAPDP